MIILSTRRLELSLRVYHVTISVVVSYMKMLISVRPNQITPRKWDSDFLVNLLATLRSLRAGAISSLSESIVEKLLNNCIPTR